MHPSLPSSSSPSPPARRIFVGQGSVRPCGEGGRDLGQGRGRDQDFAAWLGDVNEELRIINGDVDDNV
eukprot:11185395-Lingulodinium_polyedra.AAC.1